MTEENGYSFEGIEKLMEQTAGSQDSEPLTKEALEASLEKYIKDYPVWLPLKDFEAASNLERLVACIDKMHRATLAYESAGRTISADTPFQYILNYALTLVYEQDSSLLHNRRSYAEDQALDLMLAAQERLQLQEDNTGSQQ